MGLQQAARAEPNDGHRALVELERRYERFLLVTQNVDGLHQRAGSRRVLDLHGRLDVVECLTCGEQTDASVNRLVCAACGDYRTQLVSGDELLLKSIELERRQHA